MNESEEKIIHYPIVIVPKKRVYKSHRFYYPLIIFLFAYFLRRYFFCGFILGDDIQEFECVRSALANSIHWEDQFHLRFGGWFFNWIFFKILGVSEFSFFLPTWIMSATLGVIGYHILLLKKYDAISAFLSGLLIGSAPFEILIGTVRANDLILSWLLAVGLFLFLYLESTPVWQGICVAFIFWFCFYVKLWIVYLLPGLGIYYLIRIVKEKEWKGIVSFSSFSILIHSITCLIWKIKIGSYLPFIQSHAATYPVASKDLAHLFTLYPKMIFKGSEFGTTLFGIIPYLLIAGLLLKVLLSIIIKKKYFDELDYILIALYGIFFLLLNFFPNSFKFDQYYSAPRIFRYLTPISFPMTLHLCKIIIDVSNLIISRFSFGGVGKIPVFIILIVLNIIFADEATKPGQTYRNNLLEVVDDIKRQSPPEIVMESWLSHFMRAIYLKDHPRIRITVIYNTHHVSQYEIWLQNNQHRFRPGTMLLTGLGNYLHYGAHNNGFRLTLFRNPLHESWILFKEYGLLDYLPRPEPARLWQLSRQIDQEDAQHSKEKIENIGNPTILFNKGMELFEQNLYMEAQRYYYEVFTKFDKFPEADDALYFHAICFFRQGYWENTITDFTNLIKKYPDSMWIAGAYYHIGLSNASLNDKKEAQRCFEYVIKHFSHDKPLVDLSKAELQKLKQ